MFRVRSPRSYSAFVILYSLLYEAAVEPLLYEAAIDLMLYEAAVIGRIHGCIHGRIHK